MDLNKDNAIQYHYGRFPPTELDYTRILDPLLKATDVVARYDQMLKSMHNSEILLAPLRNQEAILSSRMEGTVSTMDEILKFEADFGDDKGEHTNGRSEVIETILYRIALLRTQDAMEDGYEISSSLIKQAHQILLTYGRGTSKSPGAFKSNQNYLADKVKKEILFIPISPEKLQDGVDSLFDYINNSNDPILIKTALAHVEFEALHPFEDGNGRIGRMLITLMLWDSNLISAPHFYVSGYLEENRDLYIDTMRAVSANGDWESWCVFFLHAVERQAVRNLEIAETIRDLYENMKEVFADALSSRWSVNALDFVFKHPVYRNKTFTSEAGISSATASRFTRVLLENKIILTVEKASGNKSALYSFEPLMKLVRV